MTRKHLCAAPGCEVLVPRTLLMCAAHWRLLPFDIQQDVLVKFRAFIKAETLQCRIDAARSLHLAHREAIKAVQSAQQEAEGET